MDFDDLEGTRKFGEISAYNQKLANVLFTYELARRLEGTGVIANVVEPGFVKTNLTVPFPYGLFSRRNSSQTLRLVKPSPPPLRSGRPRAQCRVGTEVEPRLPSFGA